MKNKEKIELLEKRIFCLEVKSDYAMMKEDEKFNEMLSKKPEVIQVLFKLDTRGHVGFNDEQGLFLKFYDYCKENKIDQTQIESIQLKMKEPK